MADTAVTGAAAARPAEGKTESSAQVDTGAKTESSESNGKPTKTDDGEEKWALNGKSDEKNGRRNDRSDRNDRNDRNGRSGRGRGGGRGGRGNHNNSFRNKPHNREFEKLPESDDPEEIRSQVEFYFSRANLASDHHMFMETEGPKNKPVSIHHVCSFSRMRRFKPYSAVVAALRDSKDLVVVDDGEFSKPGSEAVKRREAITVPVEDGDSEKNPSTEELFYRLKNASSNNMATSVYAKGFGSEEESGQIALEKFFRPYGAVQVRMRREDNGSWKGSVFVEFESEDSQKQFLALDPKPKFNNNELITMGKQEYIEMKCAEKGIKPDHLMTEQEKFEARKKQREANGGFRGHNNNRGRGSRRGGNDRGGNNRRRDHSPRRPRDRSGSVDDDDWKQRRDRFKSGRDDRGSRKEEKEEKKEIERDAHGVPVIKDTSEATSNKRKADTDANEGSPKKNKLEIKEDE
ncbi:hypothetical protein P3342_006145 [Pyrenophora teres f. teres]|uniref:RNA-binding La domain containing protein n=1 Tax=Pyrenophora teres f. teres TaxID=97479 RepID=A0A6S6VZ21_9PLEO|nr:hypothetical protein HRS9122_01223 [Pyrenophora teres f. teres]KAE8867540.1 hypothetical protein PTNB29_01451 [Pyrenophora teres f. teres]KAE8872308.1 hypothetical protein PTNB73_01459 [Pyrenophora teres f. teres]KAK1907816.1 hypothetical protein P3342_006145 [Pyrenophora teres f. teres]CAE7028204.1 RNA-binding La domain containing protein [Pyrenophora teres f. teres]